MPNNANNINDAQDSIYKTNIDVYGKQIKTIPAQEKQIGIDTKKTLFQNIADQGTNSVVDLNTMNSFSGMSQSRDTVFGLIDAMCEDSTISAVLETYAEDATEYNDEGRIVWCESSDAQVSKYITFLLDTMNVDKHIYKWTHALCKYGDLYLRLFRQSDYEDDGLLDNVKNSNNQRQSLNEDVKIKAYENTDEYVHYVEMWPNPAEVFELTKHGKTYAYIQADVAQATNKNQDYLNSFNFSYGFNKGDVNIHSATDFVHASLEDNSSRTPEQVTILQGGKDGKDLTYIVKRGQSLLYNVYKTWRELTLLENSLLLNRVTKSSIIRIIGVEVGDMPKESVGPHLMGIKNMIEQKASISTGKSLTEYTSPGPVENNIYVPTHEGIGAITTSEIGGNPDVKSIVDIDYYQNKLFGALRVPKQFFALTDDGAGFNGGSSLSVISSRYAKMIKRIQNTMCQCITDAIHLFLMERNLVNYVNNFSIKMLPPTTQEEIDRRENIANKIQLVSDTMNLLTDIDDPLLKIKMLKSLLSNVLTNTEITELLQEYIDNKQAELTEQETTDDSTDESELDDLDMPSDESGGGELESDVMGGDVSDDTSVEDTSSEDTGEQILPSPDDLGVDMTVNT